VSSVISRSLPVRWLSASPGCSGRTRPAGSSGVQGLDPFVHVRKGIFDRLQALEQIKQARAAFRLLQDQPISFSVDEDLIPWKLVLTGDTHCLAPAAAKKPGAVLRKAGRGTRFGS
jgi:hypothetical protein